MNTKIKLDLSEHCIETASINKFKHLMDQYFDFDKPNDNLEVKIELLKEFLGNTDFKKLRSLDERYSGTKDTNVIIKKDKSGKIITDFK